MANTSSNMGSHKLGVTTGKSYFNILLYRDTYVAPMWNFVDLVIPRRENTDANFYNYGVNHEGIQKKLLKQSGLWESLQCSTGYWSGWERLQKAQVPGEHILFHKNHGYCKFKHPLLLTLLLAPPLHSLQGHHLLPVWRTSLSTC